MPTVTTEAKKRRRRSQARRTRRRERRTREEREGSLPGWSDLAGTGSRSQEGGFLARLSTVRFALVVLAIAGACALYVGHVHATQRLLSQVEAARQENRRLHLKQRRLQSAFDEATAPSVIYRRAKALGLEEGLPDGPTIHVEPETAKPR